MLRDLDYAIDTLAIEDAREIGLRPFADARNLRAFRGLAADDRDPRILFLEIPRASHDGARGSQAADTRRDLSVAGSPDFRPRPFVVCQRIVRIGELIQDQAFSVGLHLF